MLDFLTELCGFLALYTCRYIIHVHANGVAQCLPARRPRDLHRYVGQRKMIAYTSVDCGDVW